MKIPSNLDPKKHVVFVVGPTATGKTDWGVEIAKQNNGAVISADSRQIYLEMDIGTAKPVFRKPLPTTTKDIYKLPIKYEGVDHYLFDVVYPNERYTLFDFKTQAKELIKSLSAQNTQPIVVGGTGLYIDALIKNYELTATLPEDLVLKANIQKQLDEKGSQVLWQKLNEVDPEAAAKIHPNNPHYLIRALELYELTGKTKADITKYSKPTFEPVILMTEFDRQEIYDRVEKRIDIQFEQGLIQETEELFKKYDPDLPSMTSLGYKEIKKYLDGEYNLDECKKEFKKKTRHFAKRQMTWFKRYQK